MRISVAGRDVAGAPGRDPVGQRPAAGFGVGPDDLQYAGAVPGAQVHRLHSGMFQHVFDGGQMPQRQVHHMDVIPHAGPVRRIVVIAVYHYFRPQAGGHLGNIGQQVIGDPVGILPDQPAGMRPDGIEIPQQAHAPLGVCRRQVRQDLLDHHLGIPIRVGSGGGHSLPERDRVIHAVNGGGGRKYDPAASCFPHGLAQNQGADQVVFIILQRFLHRFGHRLEPGKMDHRINLVGGKNLLHPRFVPQVGAVKADGFPRDGFDGLHHLWLRVAEIVGDHYFISRVEQFHAGMRADVARASRYEYLHIMPPVDVRAW